MCAFHCLKSVGSSGLYSVCVGTRHTPIRLEKRTDPSSATSWYIASVRGVLILALLVLWFVKRTVVFENRVLRRVFGSKRDEVTGEWRKLHNELSDLYSLPNIMRMVKSRRMRWVGHVARMGEGRGVHRVLVGKPEGKRPLGRPRRRWEDNIKMDLQEVGEGCGDWMELVQDRDRWRDLVSTVRNLRVPKMRGIS